MATFTVTGFGPFPLDMLRYDECWPASADDAVAIANSFAARRQFHHRVKLITHDKTSPTEKRWESFGWRIC